MAFDPIKLGLESHYSPAQQRVIRRMMLEDWQSSGQKLPTYMKLVSKFLIPAGIPDEILKKLSHQTMSTMLNQVSTPRHEFWACLHLYLNKKYGDIGISETGPADISVLGNALVRFGAVEGCDFTGGAFRIHDNTAVRLVPGAEFHRVAAIQRHKPLDGTSESVYTVYEGAAVCKEEYVFIVLRDITTRALKTFEKQTAELTELIDPDMSHRLDRILESA